MLHRFAPLALAALVVAPAAVSAETTPEDAASYRHELFESLGKQMKLSGMVLKGKAGKASDLLAYATAIHATSLNISMDMFPVGSGPDVVAKTRALPKIWEDPKGFDKAAKALQTESAKLVEVAKKADLEAYGAQFRNVGKSCGGCHDSYRAEEEE